MSGDRLSVFDGTAVFEVGRDAGRTKGVTGNAFTAETEGIIVGPESQRWQARQAARF